MSKKLIISGPIAQSHIGNAPPSYGQVPTTALIFSLKIKATNVLLKDGLEAVSTAITNAAIMSMKMTMQLEFITRHYKLSKYLDNYTNDEFVNLPLEILELHTIRYQLIASAEEDEGQLVDAKITEIEQKYEQSMPRRREHQLEILPTAELNKCLGEICLLKTNMCDWLAKAEEDVTKFSEMARAQLLPKKRR